MQTMTRKQPIPSHNYGDMNEQERNNEFVRICGGQDRADRLDNLLRGSNPHKGADMFGRDDMTKREVFVQRARRDGFAEREIGALLCI